MRRRSKSLAAVVAVVGASVAIGVTSAQSIVYPFDMGIALSQKGKYKSTGLFTTQLPDNPQVQSRRIQAGKTATFWLRMKNKFADAPLQTNAFGDPSEPGFDVSYFLKEGNSFGNVTDDFTDGSSCAGYEVPAGGKLLFKMKVKSTGEAGDKTSLGAGLTDGSDCSPLMDLVWAKVKVTN